MLSPSRRRFLTQLSFGAGGCLAAQLWVPRALAASTGELPRSAPEAEGVDSAAILSFLQAVAKSGFELHSLMLLRHGRVVAEGWWAPYAAEYRHSLYSLSKSFTSTAVGLAVAEGKLRVEDHVVEFFPDKTPLPISEHLAALKVRDLLTMSAGNEKEPTQTMVLQQDWVRTFLADPITHPPGSTFLYNSAATYMLSAIVQKVTGQPVLEYLQPRLFAPLGIGNVAWETCPLGINTGGWGLSLPTEALAKFGQLFLQRGEWGGKQLIPAAWVDEATTFKIQQPTPAKPKKPDAENDWTQGYGYQFWRCRHDAFRGDGAYGQFVVVMPKQDAVVVMTSENQDMPDQLQLVWDHLLPALRSEPLPANPKSVENLRQALARLKLTPPVGQAHSPLADRIAGRTFHLEGNGYESARFDFSPAACRFTVRHAQQEHALSCGWERWERGEIALPGIPPRLISGGLVLPGVPTKVAASATWIDENTLQMTWRYYETPHHDTVTCRFDGDRLRLTFLNSIAQLRSGGKDSRPEVTGTLAG